jgi:alkylated DNA repair dioxygenase AlkB
LNESGVKATMIPGLFYYPNFLTEMEEKEILDFLNTNPDWFLVSSSPQSRQVLHYGYAYNYVRKGTLERAAEFPDLMVRLKDKIRTQHPLQTEFLLNQCIINQYQPGQGIQAHIDSPLFTNYICCVSVGSGASIDFAKDGATKSLYLEPRSLYIMSDEARYQWTHGMKACKSDTGIKRGTRFSLTFRTVANEYEKRI